MPGLSHSLTLSLSYSLTLSLSHSLTLSLSHSLTLSLSLSLSYSLTLSLSHSLTLFARMLGRTRALMMWKIVVDLPVPGRATDAHIQFLAARWARFGATF